MSVIPFKSRKELTCEQNLKAFIDRAKFELTLYEDQGGFKSVNWKTAKNLGMQFTEYESSAGKGDGKPFEQPFLDFSRAYVREQQSIKEIAPSHMMRALKATYCGLKEVHGIADILLLDEPTITKARESVEARLTPQARYGTGGHMKKLFKWLKENRICLRHTPWKKSPWPRQKDRSEGTSKDDRDWQEERLLESHELAALADAFTKAKTPYEVYWSSCAVLLMFAPSRAGELYFLTTNCLFETTAIETFQNSDTGEVEDKETEVLNLRWKAAKGGGVIPKPVHPKLEHTVREAVKRLTKLGSSAREAAAWAIEHPNKFFRHSECITSLNLGENEPLSYAELCAAMGLTLSNRFSSDTMDVQEMALALSSPKWFLNLIKDKTQITYSDLAEYSAKKYSKQYPSWPNIEEVGALVSTALCLVRDNEFHKDFLAKEYSWVTPSVNEFNTALGSSDSRTEVKDSIFEQLNIRNEDESPITISTHQIRTWLSTMAERGEMDSLDLAMFAGRTRIQDNKAYDLRTPEEREATARAVLNIPKASVLGLPKDNGLRAIEAVKVGVPITYEMLGNKNRVGAAQPTGWGVCEHDWTMAPCTKAGDCVACKDHACIKGLPKSLERLRNLEVAQTKEFEISADACHRGEYGAEAWLKFNGRRLAITRTVIKMYEDGNIPEGTVIRIPKELDPTETQIALIENGLKVDINVQDSVSQSVIDRTQNELLALFGGEV
ncbi:hypothetical protein [Vibrio celticus]|uniref:Integrase n=1 Tax=Vibrio celticus TaxID=446372 RepID=A0A1C3JCX1_9VIBR|nr:hypothetical protein [Vibrio celticus]SBT12974.1 hypothetical protein VCE7224_01718 [Vibrio celticus]